MKKIVTLCTVLTLVLILQGCAKVKNDNELSIPKNECTVAFAGDNSITDNEIIIEDKGDFVEIKAKGCDNPNGVRFDTPATISFKLNENVNDEDLEKWVGVYYGGTNEYYIEPNYNKLSEGKLEFDTYHFSKYGKKKLTDEELASKYAKQLATYEIMKEEKINKLKSSSNVIVETANSIYEELGITDDTLRGTLVRDFVSELSSTINGLDTRLETPTYQKNVKMAGYGLSGLELVNAAQDGDITSFTSTIANMVVNECCEHWNDIAKNYVPSAIGSIPEALYIAIEDGNIGEATEHIAKTVVSNIPVVKYTQMTAELVDYGVNIWTDSEVQLAYDIYAGNENAGGYGETPDWDTLMIEMRGAYRQLVINAKKEYCEVNKISMEELEKDKELCDKIEKQMENSLKEQFDTRKANDDKIKAKEKEYANIIKSFNSEDVKLMTRGKNGFERNDDATFRLSRLMNIRNQVISLLGGDDVEHLYTIFGTRNVDKQNEYIAQLVETFMKQKNNYEGKKAVIDEVKFIYDVDLTKSKSSDSDDKKEETKEKTYAWVLVATEIDAKENFESDVYRSTYIGGENTHIQTDEYIWKDGPYEKATFTATFDTPPSIIYADKEFSLHHSLSCDGDTTIHYFSASCWYKPESPDVHFGGTTGRPKFSNDDGVACCDATSRPDGLRFEEYTVTGSLGSGREGEKIGIFYCGCGSDTRWIYEWKEIK